MSIVICFFSESVPILFEKLHKNLNYFPFKNQADSVLFDCFTQVLVRTAVFSACLIIVVGTWLLSSGDPWVPRSAGKAKGSRSPSLPPSLLRRLALHCSQVFWSCSRWAADGWLTGLRSWGNRLSVLSASWNTNIITAPPLLHSSSQFQMLLTQDFLCQ